MARSSDAHVSECECEHQGALRDAPEPTYNVAKPWLTVLDNLFTSDLRAKLHRSKFSPVKISLLKPTGEIGEIYPW